jgi:hypothetical protein
MVPRDNDIILAYVYTLTVLLDGKDGWSIQMISSAETVIRGVNVGVRGVYVA